MKHWRLGAALLGLFIVVLVATAPARLLGFILPGQSVALQGYRGSLWHGTAASAAIAMTDGWLQLGQVEWRLAPFSLLLLSPRLELESRWGLQRIEANVSVSPGGTVHFRDSEASFSAALIRQWLPVQLRGSLSLVLADLRLHEGSLAAGRGRLVWQQAYWTGDRGSQALGDYVLEFEVSGEQQVNGTVTTLKGPIRAEGEFRVQGRRYTVDTLLTSEQGFDSELASALQLLAAPVEGGFRVKFSSEF